MTAGIQRQQLAQFGALGVVSIASVLLAFYTNQLALAFVPIALLIVGWCIVDFRSIYFLLLATLPISMEFYFSPTLGTDLPDEPLMLGLMLITFVFLASKLNALPRGFHTHVLVLALLSHLFWIFVCTICSVNMLVSGKVFLAKLWYVTTFTVLTAILIKGEEGVRAIFWCIFIPLTLAMLKTFVQYGVLYRFHFEDVNQCMWPFFRNHVNYAAILSCFFPFLLRARSWYERGSAKRQLIGFSIILYIVAIYFSYTRTCMLALLMIVPFQYIVRQRMMKAVVGVVLLALLLLGTYLFHDNRYLEYAPNYGKTITHHEFGSHISATFEGQDVSSMERIYRWVAATKMFQDRPVFGFGPGNFYPYYKQYTVLSFQTYISDNEEHSTTHNYFLLLLCEQGVLGLLIFLLLSAVLFIYGERIYWRTKNETHRATVIMLLTVICMVYVNILLSDLLESDKVGPFFFMCIALLVVYDGLAKHQDAKKQSI